MPHGAPGAIFHGRVQPNQYPYLSKVLNASSKRFDRFVVLCAGSFTMPEVAKKSGWKLEQIETSDVSLYSTVLGYAITGRSMTDLGVQVHNLDLPSSVSLETPEGILYAFKYAINQQLISRGKMNDYDKMFHLDMRRRAKDHLDTLARKVETISTNLRGISYEAKDLFEHLKDVERDPRTLILSCAPFYGGDFESQFDTGDFLTWNEPNYHYFDPREDYPQLRERLLNVDGMSLWYWVFPDEEDLERAVFAWHDGKGKVKALLSSEPKETANMAGGISVIEKRLPPSVSANLPIMPADYEIRPDSTLQVIPCSSQQATYYRDLFVHRMGSTIAERTFLYLLDGMVWAVVGVNSMRFNIGSQDYLEETYGITRTSRHWRLGRLLSQTLVSREFLDICTDERVNRKPTGIRGTVWSRHSECKASRGAFKLVERQFDQKAGLYKLRNHGKAREVTLQQTLERWLKAEGDYWKEFAWKRGGAEVEVEN